MIIPVFLVALALGVTLAALDCPYTSGSAWIERLCVGVLTIGLATVATCGALAIGDRLFS